MFIDMIRENHAKLVGSCFLQWLNLVAFLLFLIFLITTGTAQSFIIFGYIDAIRVFFAPVTLH